MRIYKMMKPYIKFLMAICLLFTTIICPIEIRAVEQVVSITQNGPRLMSAIENIDTPSYQWQISDTVDGTFTDISGANQYFYDIQGADEGKYIRLKVNSAISNVSSAIGKLIVFDVSKKSVTLGSNYSGKNSDGIDVNGTHESSNLYVIMQKDTNVYTENVVKVNGNDSNPVFDITIAGVHMSSTPVTGKKPNSSGIGGYDKGVIDFSPTNDTKNVTLRIKNENIIRGIRYSTSSSENSSLKITDINGDGKFDDVNTLYVPVKKVTLQEIEEYVNSDLSYNHWNSAIGGDDGSKDKVTNFEIAGGYVQALTSYADNCTAIGAGGNGHCTMTISGGKVVAHTNGTGTAIGGGIGWNSHGGSSNITITGGDIYAKNHGNIYVNVTRDGEGKATSFTFVDSDGDYNEVVGGVAIGSGSSFISSGSDSTVTITGGTVKAYGTFGNGIGGGNSSASTGGEATINISGGNVDATSIGGGSSQNGVGGSATVNVDGTAVINLEKGIGGGDSNKGAGGDATITIDNGSLTCGDVVGGGNGALDGNGGAAIVTVNNGTLISKSIGGGTGGVDGNGGRAEIEINGGTIKTGTIGGGNGGANGHLGYANALIKDGDIQGQFIMAAAGSNHCTFDMRGGELYGVDTSDTSTYVYKPNGAAVYMNDPDGVATISGGTIRDCKAENGGAVYMSAGTFTISGDAKIENCTAINDGGAVYLGGGSLTINGGNVNGNKAINGGGAFVDGGNVFVYGGKLESNTANKNGGAIAINNGNFRMVGGELNNNISTTGLGGAVYVSADEQDAKVEVLSGTIRENEAALSGGAVAVQGKEGSSQKTLVQIGVKEQHFKIVNDEMIPIDCNHADAGENMALSCPVVVDNLSHVNGGAIYMSGDENATLNLYCVEETGSKVGDGNAQLSNFMKVEGGNVKVSTSSVEDKVNYKDNQNDLYGNISITNTIHVTGGNMEIWGKMTNPETSQVITVDITDADDSFKDYRLIDGFYKLIYYENFTDPETDITTGQYRIYNVEIGQSTKILENIYYHPGYTIDSWNTSADGSILTHASHTPANKDDMIGKYFVNEEYTIVGDVTIYAIWKANGYPVTYDPNSTDYSGSMPVQNHTYDQEVDLLLNQYERKGYEFIGWNEKSDGSGTTYSDGQRVKNLSTVFGQGVKLYAIWKECDHNESTHEYIYTLEENDTVLRKTCSCKGKTDTVQLIASNENYDKSAHDVTVIYSSSTWRPTVVYKKGSTTLASAPVNAGTYTANVSDHGKTASVTFEVLKIKQDAPEKPVDYITEDAGTTTKLYIKTVKDSPLITSDPTGYDSLPQYKIVYEDGGVEKDSGWVNESIITIDGVEYGAYFELNVALTNYHIYARYGEGTNYLASNNTEANSTYFFTGNIKLEVYPGNNVIHTVTEASKSGGVTSGIKIEVEAEDGYFLPNDFALTIITKTAVDGPVHSQQAVLAPVSGKEYEEYLISNIPQDCYIEVTISDAVKIPTITGTVTEKKVFGDIDTNTATITRNSSYSINYKVNDYNKTNYETLTLSFYDASTLASVKLPKESAIIMLDKNDKIYYSYVVKENDGISSLELTSFIRNGTEDTEFVCNDGDLDLQFVVNFEYTQNGMNGTQLRCALNVPIRAADATRASSIKKDIDVNLKDKYEFALNISDTSYGLEKQITYTVDNKGGISANYDSKGNAIVLTPNGCVLPADAQLKVNFGNDSVVYPVSTVNTVSCFIIPLDTLHSGTMNIELITRTKIVQNTEFKMSVEWIASESEYNEAIANGEVLEDGELTFIYEDKKVPEILIKGAIDSQIYESTDYIYVDIYWKNVQENQKIEMVMMKKAEDGNYTSTGVKMEIDHIDNQYNFEEYYIKGNGSHMGSYYLEAYVLDGLEIVASSKYYLIIE